MPLYEFHCGSCRKDSEILVRSSNWKGTECPHCGSTKLSKKLSVFAASVSGGNGPAECGNPEGCPMPGKKRGRGHGGGCACCH